MHGPSLLDNDRRERLQALLRKFKAAVRVIWTCFWLHRVSWVGRYVALQLELSEAADPLERHHLDRMCAALRRLQRHRELQPPWYKTYDTDTESGHSSDSTSSPHIVYAFVERDRPLHRRESRHLRRSGPYTHPAQAD